MKVMPYDGYLQVAMEIDGKGKRKASDEVPDELPSKRAALMNDDDCMLAEDEL